MRPDVETENVPEVVGRPAARALVALALSLVLSLVLGVAGAPTPAFASVAVQARTERPAAVAAPQQAGPQQAARQAAAQQAAAQAAPGQSRQCAARLRAPRKPVKPAVFAACTVKAMKVGRTATVRTAMSDGSVGVGPYRFRTTTDASVRSNDGSRQVALGKDFWLKPKGGSWVRARANGSRAQREAYLAGQLWRGLASAAAFKKYLSSSTEPWTPTGRTRKVNGVRAREYSGKPSFGGLDFDAYHVWLDQHHRPVRVTYSATAFGQETSMRQDWSRWGRKVTITAPRTR